MTTYYVSSQIGNDNNAGTSAAAPFASLQAAANHTAPGDTVLVMNGTYTSGDPVLQITTGGTASAPITFAAAPGQTPVIDSSGNWNAIDVRAPYIVISGFTIVGNAASITLQQALANASPGTPLYDGNGIAVHASHVTIQNCTVHDEPGGGIYTEGADYVQILNNIVYNNAHWSVYGNSGISVASSINADTAPGPHIIISGNLVYGNSELVPEYRAGAITDGEGIILDSNSGYTGGFLVQKNTVHDNGGPGIEAFLSNNAVITLNIVYGNNTQNVQAPSNSEIFINQSNNVTITDNSTGDPNDHTPPDPPIITGDTVDFNLVTLFGTAEPNSTIKVSDNSTLLSGTATTNASGQWSFTTGALPNGSQSFIATATDTSLNESTPSAPLVVVLNSPVNLVNNGNFETGNLNGWTLSGTLTSPPWGPTIYIDTHAEFGQYAVGMGAVGSDSAVSQTIATTPGQQYTLSFWLQNEGGGPNDFTATWNGQALLALTNSAAFGYKEYTYTVTATGSTTVLQFSARQDPSLWDLDAISLTPVTASPAAGSVSINDVTISEGDSGTKVATFTVTRSGGTAAFAVNFATSDGTATVADGDYVATSGTLNFGANENTKTIAVTINGDTKVEANETFNVVLSNATNGATISDNQGVGTITNDDSTAIAGSVSINDVTISEGDSGTKVATFTVTRSGGTAAFNVNFATSDATATVADGDYVATSGTLSFGANENTKTIAVTINGDTKVEANETFNVVLSNATNGATISDNQGVGTITNDDSAAVSLVNNGNFETGNLNGWTLSGTLTSPWGPTIYIDTHAEFGQYAVGMGAVGSDSAVSQTIATTPGQQYTLSFWLQNEGGGPNDFTATWNGQALLALTNSAAFGYKEYTYTVTATGSTTVLQFSARQDPSLWDLDAISLTPVTASPAAGSVSINDVTISEGDSGTEVATFTVTRSGGTAAFAVNFATSDGTATVADGDYVATSGTLNFGANENTKTIAVTINGDTKVEANETFNVVLSNATNGVTISDNQGVGTITNDDSAAIAGSVSINDVTISEGDSGTKVATFTVTRSGGTAAFAVNFATSDGTATVADGDHVATSGTLNFGANENTKTIAVTINGDTKVEANETFNVLLSNATNGATISDNQGVGTITNDDSAAIAGSVSINDVTISEGDSGTKVATFTVTRSGGTAAFAVNFATSDGTATVADGDHVATSGTLNFGANENTKTIAVTINGDTKVEANETFNVLLSNATNGVTISDNQGVGTITNDDSAASNPAARVIASFATDSGVIGDGVTNDTTLTLTGTAPANNTVNVYDGKQIGTAAVNASGAWNYTTSTLADGKHSFTATDTNSTGNISAPSSTLAVTVDTVAPAQPVMSSFSGTSSSVTLTGTGEANSAIQAFDGTIFLGNAPVNASGNWNLTTSSLAAGAHNFTATDTDAAGNTSVGSSPLALNVMTGTPATDFFASRTTGNYIMTGEGGPDIFLLFGANFGKIVITDFQTAGSDHDIIYFSQAVFSSFAALQSHATQVGANVVITVDAADTVTLAGVKLTDLSSSDFQYL